MTEIRMIDTYWFDHCRHTTFLTHRRRGFRGFVFAAHIMIISQCARSSAEQNPFALWILQPLRLNI
ncbi:MAG: hypothetical protein ACLR56_03370 [Oscillospiraceae bacterium]